MHFDHVVAAVKLFAARTHFATLALQDGARGNNVGRATAAVSYFRRGDFENGFRMYTLPKPPLSEPDDDVATKRRRRFVTPMLPPKPVRSSWFAMVGRGSAMQWMMKRPLQFAGLASVIVVSTVGLQVQYLNNNGFSGSLGDWLGLALWSAVIELSGVSVLDVLGRLGAGARPQPQSGLGALSPTGQAIPTSQTAPPAGAPVGDHPPVATPGNGTAPSSGLRVSA